MITTQVSGQPTDTTLQTLGAATTGSVHFLKTLLLSAESSCTLVLKSGDNVLFNFYMGSEGGVITVTFGLDNPIAWSNPGEALTLASTSSVNYAYLAQVRTV